MSKERQRLRAEREAARARAAERQARRDARAARRRARVARAARLLPRRSGRPGGILARRRREQNAVVAVLFVLVQVLAWVFLQSWTGRLAVLALSAFLVPVFVTLAFDRRS